MAGTGVCHGVFISDRLGNLVSGSGSSMVSEGGEVITLHIEGSLTIPQKKGNTMGMLKIA